MCLLTLCRVTSILNQTKVWSALTLKRELIWRNRSLFSPSWSMINDQMINDHWSFRLNAWKVCWKIILFYVFIQSLCNPTKKMENGKWKLENGKWKRTWKRLNMEKGMEKTKHGKECGKGLGKGYGKGLKHREKWKRTGNVCERKHCSTPVLQHCKFALKIYQAIDSISHLLTCSLAHLLTCSQ